jgi:hypothetical protein
VRLTSMSYACWVGNLSSHDSAIFGSVFEHYRPFTNQGLEMHNLHIVDGSTLNVRLSILVIYNTQSHSNLKQLAVSEPQSDSSLDSVVFP